MPEQDNNPFEAVLAGLGEESGTSPMLGEAGAENALPQGDAEPAPSQPAAAEASKAPEWNGKDWEFDWQGRKIYPDSRDKLKTWASQGYNYSQRMGELNKQRAELEAKYKGYDQYHSINDFIQKDPKGKDWWKHVEDSWEKRSSWQPGQEGHGQAQQQQQQPGQSPDFSHLLKPYEEKIQRFEKYLEEQEKLKAEQDQKQADEALSAEVESTRKEFPTIDFNAVDGEGKTVEQRVYEHAAAVGAGSFRASFLDLFLPQILESAKAQKLADEAKQKELDAKKGIIGKTRAPTKGVDAPVNVKGKSYDDLARLALEEMMGHTN
jgi:hypothetical protein